MKANINQIGRIWWSLARDHATPFPKLFSYVNEGLSCPIPATVFCGKPSSLCMLTSLSSIAILCTGFGAIQLGSKTAFTDLVGSFVILTTSSYFLSIFPHILTKRSMVPKGPFWMGKYGYAINGIACLGIVFFNIMFCFRKFLPSPSKACCTRLTDI
jgi:choline transport protein